MISIRLSFLTIFLFFFFTRCFVLLPFIFFIHRLGWQERSEWKPCQERKSKIVLSSQRLWKSLPLNSDDPLRWNCDSRDFTGLWCVIFGYLFIYLRLWSKQFLYFAYPFYFLETLFWKMPFFLLCFQSIILTCGMC